MINIFAPAKVNLTLHVTGQRDDGYHLLDSLVCFPEIGDDLTFTPADETTLTIRDANDAPSDLPVDDTNLVIKAANLFMPDRPMAITLQKHLPVASGIGGGSADAAAVIRAARLLSQLSTQTPQSGQSLQTARSQDAASNAQDHTTALSLGADVPVCINSSPSRMAGIGDVVTPIHTWPDHGHMLLVNPRVHVSTPEIFRALTQKTNPAMPKKLPEFSTLDTLVAFLKTTRNDLQGPAIAQQPIIADVIDIIAATPGCLFARMSGSGATCFGIYGSGEDGLNAAAKIRSNFPNWWIECGPLTSE